MQRFRSKLVAWGLLLLLGRVLAPEAAVLGLHAHEHTADEPAQRLAGRSGERRALLSVPHTHCHAEPLYDVPALLAGPVLLPRPLARPRYAGYFVAATYFPGSPQPLGTASRGPPLA